MFKWLFRNDGHVHCFSDKKRDHRLEDGTRIITMACNKCELQEDHVIPASKQNKTSLSEGGEKMSYQLVKVKRTIVELAWCKQYENGDLEFHDHIDEIEVLEEAVVQ